MSEHIEKIIRNFYHKNPLKYIIFDNEGENKTLEKPFILCKFPYNSSIHREIHHNTMVWLNVNIKKYFTGWYQWLMVLGLVDIYENKLWE